MSPHPLTRRALLAGAGTAVASAAIAVPHVSAAHADDSCELHLDTDGLTGLPLAAVHIECAVQAMAPVTFGRWQVTITSGDANQPWCFKQINPDRRDPILDAIQAYEAGMDAYNTSGIPDRIGFTDEERDDIADATYRQPLEALDNWAAPAVTHQGAVAALRFACKEANDFAASDAMVALMHAALAYFEKHA